MVHVYRHGTPPAPRRPGGDTSESSMPPRLSYTPAGHENPGRFRCELRPVPCGTLVATAKRSPIDINTDIKKESPCTPDSV